MSSLAARLLDALDPTAASKAAAVTGQQEPTADQLAADSADRAEQFGSGDADGPALEPVWEGERPLLADTIAELTRTLRSTLLTPPAPDSAVCGQHVIGSVKSVQVLPPSGGRLRMATVRNTGPDVVYVSPDPRVDTSGFVLAAGADIEVDSASPVYAVCATGDASTVSTWADYFAEG